MLTHPISAGIAAARLGAKVTATDLGPNLPLLRANCAANGVSSGPKGFWRDSAVALRLA